MATISGPNIQLPTQITSMLDENGIPQTQWQAFFNAVQGIAYAGSRSGPTLSRPTQTLAWRYVGMPYFDTSLGFPVFLQSVNPDVWVDGTGTPV